MHSSKFRKFMNVLGSPKTVAAINVAIATVGLVTAVQKFMKANSTIGFKFNER